MLSLAECEDRVDGGCRRDRRSRLNGAACVDPRAKSPGQMDEVQRGRPLERSISADERRPVTGHRPFNGRRIDERHAVSEIWTEAVSRKQRAAWRIHRRDDVPG